MRSAAGLLVMMRGVVTVRLVADQSRVGVSIVEPLDNMVQV
jgi:hypothetical protein